MWDLVFDQFEEVLTLGTGNAARVSPLRVDMADLIENRIPAALARRDRFGTGTTANSLYTASASGANVTVKALTIDSRAYKVSSWTTNISVPNGVILYPGSSGVYQSALTPQGFGRRVRLVLATGGNCVGFVFGSYDGSVESNLNETNGGMAALVVAAARTLQIFADPYWLCTFMLGSSTTPGCVVMGGVPYVMDAQIPLTISGASNASPIEITTASPNGYTTGDQVFIDGVQGNTAANGLWTVTVISPTTFSLSGSSGNGSYTSGGLSGNDSSIARIVFAAWDTGTDNLGTQRGCWRSNLHC
jgi:hypothetical protein